MTVRSAAADIAVIGAGSSGLAALKALLEQGVTVDCFERGSDVGGLWRYENDNGLSGAYASLRTNVSRPRMQYPSFPTPCSYADFPGHREMAAYLDAYADAFGLREFIRFRATVERLALDPGAGWWLTLDDGSVRRYRAVVVAIGLFWCPKVPAYPGAFGGVTIHSHEYRTSGRCMHLTSTILRAQHRLRPGQCVRAEQCRRGGCPLRRKQLHDAVRSASGV